MTDKPADKVRNDVADFLDTELGNAIGQNLRHLTWDGDEDDDDPFGPLIVKDSDGRRFEIEFEVMVTELTEAVMADRAALVAQLQAFQANARGAS